MLRAPLLLQQGSDVGPDSEQVTSTPSLSPGRAASHLGPKQRGHHLGDGNGLQGQVAHAGRFGSVDAIDGQLGAVLQG